MIRGVTNVGFQKAGLNAWTSAKIIMCTNCITWNYHKLYSITYRISYFFEIFTILILYENSIKFFHSFISDKISILQHNSSNHQLSFGHTIWLISYGIKWYHSINIINCTSKIMRHGLQNYYRQLKNYGSFKKGSRPVVWRCKWYRIISMESHIEINIIWSFVVHLWISSDYLKRG